MLHAAGIHKPEALFFLAAIKTGCFLQIWFVFVIRHVIHSPLLLWTNQVTSLPLPPPLLRASSPWNGPLDFRECIFVITCETSHSCVLAIVISVWLLSSILHEAPEWTWLLLATLNKYFRVSSSFARNWVCFWMIFKRRKGECWIMQLCSYQNSLLIFNKQCYSPGSFFFPWRVVRSLI